VRLNTCNKCGRVAFSVPRSYAEGEVARFNEWFNKQPQETKDSYGGKPSSIKGYEQCMFCCGNYKQFHRTTREEKKKIYGCTLSPIIQKKD
jgi:hypothetical protein